MPLALAAAVIMASLLSAACGTAVTAGGLLSSLSGNTSSPATEVDVLSDTPITDASPATPAGDGQSAIPGFAGLWHLYAVGVQPRYLGRLISAETGHPWEFQPDPGLARMTGLDWEALDELSCTDLLGQHGQGVVLSVRATAGKLESVLRAGEPNGFVNVGVTQCRAVENPSALP